MFTPGELQEAETLWLKQAQQSLYSRTYLTLSALPLRPRSDQSWRQSRQRCSHLRRKTPRTSALRAQHSISSLITRHMHQCGHSGVVITTAKIRARYWILKASKLPKSVKFKCGFCREMARRGETQQWPTSLHFVWHLSLHPFTTQRVIISGPLRSRSDETRP